MVCGGRVARPGGFDRLPSWRFNKVMRCSHCGKPVEPISRPPELRQGPPDPGDDTPGRRNPHFPFCSRRCQQLDLASWLNEEIQVPHEGGESRGNESDSAPREIVFDQDDGLGG
ncbi:MAG: DNA gyrase inhibitor YacG [Planctomycetota bacterium]